MAIPKKGSRFINVNLINYRWLIRKKPTYTQADYGNGFLNVAIEIEDNPETTLIIYTNHRHPNDIGVKEITPITPHLISSWILKALDLGWKPTDKGAQFRAEISSNNELLKL